MGRPRAIQGEVRDRLLYALEQGTPVREACEYAGVDPSTYSDELNRNPEFAAHARAVKAKHLPKALEDIRRDVDWRAKRAWAEMSFPAAFAQRLELSQSGPLAITLDFGGAPAPAQSSDAKED